MTKPARTLFGLIGLASIIACAGPSIDMSSLESAEESLDAVAASMPDRDADIRAAFQYLMFPDIGGALGAAFASFISEAAGQSLPEGLRHLDGYSAEDLLRVATDSATADFIRREAQLRIEVDSLRTVVAAVDEARATLGEVAISNASIRSVPQRFGRDEIEIRFDVTNGTAAAFRRLFFRGVLATEGRSVPWVDAEFNYVIPGGIEPGESQQLRLAPNMFSSAWSGFEDAPSDATFTVTVENAEFADESSVIEFSDTRAAEQLATAESELSEIEAALAELRSSETSFRESLKPPPQSLF